jgi:hypothetical protein
VTTFSLTIGTDEPKYFLESACKANADAQKARALNTIMMDHFRFVLPRCELMVLGY